MSTYIVWSPTAYQPPTRTFPSETKAAEVAQIMAQKHPGSTFHVCKIMGTAKMRTAEYTKAS